MSDTDLIQQLFTLTQLMKQSSLEDTGLSNLTIVQLQALITIKKQEGCPMSDIARELHIELPSATSLVNKLVAIKLVERVNDPKDRRIIRISLTQNGKDLFAKAMTQRKKVFEKILSHIDVDDKKTLQRILANLIHSMEETHEK